VLPRIDTSDRFVWKPSARWQGWEKKRGREGDNVGGEQVASYLSDPDVTNVTRL